MYITKEQIRHIRYLLSRLPVAIEESEKSNMVKGYTGERTGRISEMTKDEAIKFTEDLRKATLSPEEEKADALRKAILQIAWQMGWQKGGRVDMDRVNAFLSTRGANREGKQGLNSYSYDELLTLRDQFIAMHKNKVRSI